MNYTDSLSMSREGLRILSLLPETGIIRAREEILAGLLDREKYILSKYFYDPKGSELYSQITRLEAYYPTRTEKAILKRIAAGVMRDLPAGDLVELGPGDPSKISLLLSAGHGLKDLSYRPMDISTSAILKLSEEIIERFPGLEVEARVLDFTRQQLVLSDERPSLLCFFGSTLGNFHRFEGSEMLASWARAMKSGDRFLLGLDLVKDEEVLFAAYNDPEGVTAAFNLNILSSVNTILESDLQEGDFKHVAFYDREQARIEMHLEALRDVQVRSPYLEQPVRIRRGEHIHTENSHKFTKAHILALAGSTGLEIRTIHRDERHWFAIVELQKP